MRLTVRPVRRKLPEYPEIRALLEQAFPREERLPTWILMDLSFGKNIEFSAYYDGEEFCALSYLARARGMVYLLFLAVKDSLRSRGYGTAILEQLRARYPGCPVVLNAEEPYPEAGNFSQRLRRLEFYRRSGYESTGYCHVDKKESYCILSSGGDFSPGDYIYLLKKRFHHLYPVRLEKRPGTKA